MNKPACRTYRFIQIVHIPIAISGGNDYPEYSGTRESEAIVPNTRDS